MDEVEVFWGFLRKFREFRNNFGTILEMLWNHFAMVLGLFWN